MMICLCVCNLFCYFVIVGVAVDFTVTITLNLLSTQKRHSNSSICHRFLSLFFSLFYSSEWILMMKNALNMLNTDHCCLYSIIIRLFVLFSTMICLIVFIHYDSVEILFLCHFLLNETLDWRKQYIFCMVHHEYQLVHVDTRRSTNRTNTNFFLLVYVCRHFLRTKLINSNVRNFLGKIQFSYISHWNNKQLNLNVYSLSHLPNFLLL